MKRALSLFLLLFAFAAYSMPQIICKSTKNPLSYSCGDTIEFKLSIEEDGVCISGKQLEIYLHIDGKEMQKITLSTKSKPIIHKIKLDMPGFVRFQIYAKNEDGTPMMADDNGTIKEVDYFDGGAGADVRSIFPLESRPEDFDTFWDGWIRKLCETQPEIEWIDYPVSKEGYVIKEFRITVLPGMAPATGIITYPEEAIKEGKKLDAHMGFDGYNSPSASSYVFHEDAICIRVNRQPISNQGNEDYYKEQKEIFKGFCFRNNDTPEQSDYFGMILRDMRGFDVARSLPFFSGNFTVEGGSMGGFRSIVQAALNPDVVACSVSIPWSCDFSGPAHGRISGWRPDYVPALKYFDPVFMANRIHCPVTIGLAGLGDYVSPPSGIMAFFNSLKTPAAITFVQGMKHGFGASEDSKGYYLFANLDNSEKQLEPLPTGMPDLRYLPWQSSRRDYCKAFIRNGRGILSVHVPEKTELSGQNTFSLSLNPSWITGQTACVHIKYRTQNVSEPPKPYLGSKFMLICSSKKKDVPTAYHDAWLSQGTNDWLDGTIYQKIAPQLDGSATLIFGMQRVTGLIEFEIDSLESGQIYTAENRKNLDYKTQYREDVAKAQLRGVMSSGADMTEEMLQVLQSWNCNLVRYQLMRNWLSMNTELDIKEYFQWLDKKLDNIEALSKIAPKYGIRFIIDMHSPPGGKSGWYNMRIFSEEKYTEAYLECWKRIAARFKGNPAIFGYDLINEPFQGGPSQDSGFFDLQVRAGKAIRAIDPDSVLIVTTLYGGSSTIGQMSLVPLDNVIYTVHFYTPGAFTHPGNKGQITYPGMAEGEYWDKERLRKALQPIRDFQLEHGVRIYIGEFSAIVWAPGADQWIKDVTDIFDEYGWMYSFHAFREWAGWSVEHDGTCEEDLHPADNTPRKQALLRAFARNPK